MIGMYHTFIQLNQQLQPAPVREESNSQLLDVYCDHVELDPYIISI